MVKKILIIGCCGSGKSTLSKKLEEITNLPVIHLDKEYYKPNWEKPAKGEWDRKVLDLCNKEQWIMDGNYISSMEIRARYAEMIIWLDINRVLCLYRAILRAILPSKRHRSDMGEGCEERHDYSFYLFIWNFYKTTRPRIKQLIDSHQDIDIRIVRNKREMKYLLEEFNASYDSIV